MDPRVEPVGDGFWSIGAHLHPQPVIAGLDPAISRREDDGPR
jgi:hypothetical protein